MTRARRSSSRSRARSPDTRASCESANTASVVSRPGVYPRSRRAVVQRSALSRATTVLAGPNKGTRAPTRPRLQRTCPAGFGRREVLDKRVSQRLLHRCGQSFERGRAPPDLGQLVCLGLGPAALLGRTALGWEEQWGEPAMDLLVMGLVQPRRDAPPEDPPLGPALRILDVLDPLVERRPEGLDPRLVEREPDTGPEDVAGHVEPPRLVLRRFIPPIGQVPKRLPAALAAPRAATSRGGRPGILPVASRAAPDLARRGRLPRKTPALIAAMPASSSDCSMTTEAASASRIAGTGRARSMNRGAESGAASGGRRSASGTRPRSSRPPSPSPRAGPAHARPSPSGQRGCAVRSGGRSRIDSGPAATRSPGRSSGRTEELASGNVTG